MNAPVSTCILAEYAALEKPELLNRVPVKIDTTGRVWVEGTPLACPPIFPSSSRGELVFAPEDTGLLLGPWGPDPSCHLILAGRYAGLQGGRLTLKLGQGGDLAPQVSLPMEATAGQTLKPRQRVWLSIPLSALQYCC